MKIDREKTNLHPILIEYVDKIQKEIILVHDMPIRMFETSRTKERHQMLIDKGRTKNIISRHRCDLDRSPPLYTTAVDYVFYDGKWSWNLRDNTVKYWYMLFGNMVLDLCPGMRWHGSKRKAVDYNHFELSKEIIEHNLDKIPCVVPM